jgi:surfactin synthase thioesterase subunit
MHVIPGGHFYYLDRLDAVVRAVHDVLPESESGVPGPAIVAER